MLKLQSLNDSNMNKINIKDRSQKILTALVSRYIRDGQPVGSKTIAEDSCLSLSSATIRNILAELEDVGLVRSPHTSAGRVPTNLGYRFFVNSLLQVKNKLYKSDFDELPGQLNASVSEQELLESASALISNMTQLTGIVTIPKHEQLTFRHIEFLSLSQNRILVILVLNEQEVQNLIIQTDREYTDSELQQAANFIMTHYNGKDLTQIRQMLLNEMHSDHESIDTMMHKVFDSAEKHFQHKEDYVITGESNLLNLAPETGVDQLRSLFEAFSCKRDVLHLLDQCLDSEGIQIFIGQESGQDILDGCSLITAPYALGDRILGVLGVIGPTRMNYERVINAVDVTARLLSAAFKERS